MSLDLVIRIPLALAHQKNAGRQCYCPYETHNQSANGSSFVQLWYRYSLYMDAGNVPMLNMVRVCRFPL